MILKRTQIIFLLAAVFMLLFSFHGSSLAADRKLTVAGASDLSMAFKEIVAEFEKETGYKVVLSLGSTGMLAGEVAHGAPLGAFYAEGRIVIATKRDTGLKIIRLEDLKKNNITRIAIANPEHAPYGMAAMEALKSAGLWEELKSKLVYGENIRQALQFVESGNAEAGIIARSVAQTPNIEFFEVPSKLHKPISQAAGVVSSSKEKDGARAFIKFVNGPKGAPIMKKYGFLPPDGR